MSNSLENDILDYFPDERSKEIIKERFIYNEIPENYILLNSAQYSYYFKNELQELQNHNIHFLLELFKDDFANQTSLYLINVYVNENDINTAVEILKKLDPDISDVSLPSWKPADIQGTFIKIIIVILILIGLYLLAIANLETVSY